MGVSNFINKRFLNKEIYLYLGEEAEMIVLEQSWVANKEIIHGMVIEVDEDIIVLKIHSGEIIYVNGNEVKMFWEQDFDYHRCTEGHITKRVQGAKNKDNRILW